jgi:hypothetical protein
LKAEPLGNNKPDAIVTAFDPRDKAKNTSVLSGPWSVADNPKSVTITMPKAEVRDTKFQGDSLDASLVGTTPDQLSALATDMLFIGKGRRQRHLQSARPGFCVRSVKWRTKDECEDLPNDLHPAKQSGRIV